MSRWLMAIVSLAMLASCSEKTNEEKARELIEPQIKANLIKPESYEFAQMQLDSCFSDNSDHNPDILVFALKVAKLFNDYKKYKGDVEQAETYMSIYVPSYGYQSTHSKQQYQKYKAEMERAKRKADTVKESILQLYKENKQFFQNPKSSNHEFTGWIAAFDYRAETAGGLKTMDVALFFMNKDLTEITHRFSKEDLLLLQSEGLDDIKYEFEEELKELFDEE